MTREDHKLLRSKQSQYICPTCKLKHKNVKTDNTPIRSKQNTPGQDQTSHEFLVSAHQLANMEVPAQIMTAFSQAVADLQSVFMSMKTEMADFVKTLNCTTDEIDTFRHELGEIKHQLKELDRCKAEVVELRLEVTELRQELAAKEQIRFLKDVEITGITENNTENLPQLVTVIAATLGVELDPRDVDEVRRVGPRGKPGPLERPRPIVVSMTRRGPRDQLLRAARARRGLTTDKLQLPGNPRRVYLNEHLTKINRILFSKARKLGNELHFKYVWTSNGNIFMRRSDTSSVLHVTSEAVLEKLEAQNRTSTAPTISEPKTCS